MTIIKLILSVFIFSSVLHSEIISSPEKDWPQWRGKKRDGIVQTGPLLEQWPQQGPELLYKLTDLGRGYSSPIIIGDKMFITGDVEDDLIIYCFNLNGEKLWTTKNGQSWKKSFPGARATCVYSEGKLWHVNAHGRLASFDAESGKELWSFNIIERFQSENIRWGISECLLIDSEHLYITPGGSKCVMAALNKNTGETIWMSDPIEGERAAYASPILFKHHQKRLIANCSSRHVFVVDANSGKLLWKQERPTRFEVIGATPVYYNGGIFVASPDGAEGGYYQMDQNGINHGPTWTNSFDNIHGGMLAVNDILYGAGDESIKGWAAIDLKTGKTLYTEPKYKMGSCIYADGKLYAFSEDSTMLLLKPTQDKFEILGEFKLVEKRVKNAWAYPVIHQSKLYIRYQETLYCYNIKK